MSQCPECEGPLEMAADVMSGEVVPCAQCGAELEVTSTSPIAVALAPEVQEDWGE